MKRQRQDEAEDTSTKAGAGAGAGGGFRFGFFGDGSGPAGSPDEAEAEAQVAAPRLDPGPWGREALLLPAPPSLSSEAPPATATAPASGPQRVRVLWEESVGRQGLVKVQLLGEGEQQEVLKVEPSRLAASSLHDGGAPPPPTPTPTAKHLEEHDLVFHAQHHLHTPAAPPLGPSLASLVYPVAPGRFLSEIYGRRALAVHELGGRARRVLRDLVASAAAAGAAPGGAEGAAGGGGNKRRKRRRGGGAASSSSSAAAAAPAASTDALDVAALLRAATRTVVWMRARDGGKEMQYLDEVPPQVAWACHRAGHSLYFNPPLAFQRPYVSAVLRALGMEVGEGDGDGGGGGMGGDVEVFAVRGPHTTPWHFDAQDNITIQLRGCKRWRLKPSGLPDPLTNLHPASASTAAVQRDRALHAACSPPSTLSPPPQPAAADDDDHDTVLLRPGSVLYVPCGWWHSVESLGDHPEGSLSINLSLDPRRWAGLLHASLGPALWGADSLRARARRVMGDGEGGGDVVAATRAAAGRMLEALRERLAAVAPADLLPLAAFEDAKGGDGGDGGDGEEEEGEGESGGAVIVEVEAQDQGVGDEQLLLLADEDDTAEARARARGSDQASAGLSKRAGWPQDFGAGPRVAVAGGAAAAAIALVRNPLAALVLEAGNGPPRSTGRMAVALHRGFPMDLAPSPAVTVRIEVPPAAFPALTALARLGPGARTSVQEVAAIAGLALEGEQALLLWKLVGVLVYHGFVRPDAVG